MFLIHTESDEELESSQQSLYKKMMRQEIKIKQEEKISSPFDNSEKNAMGKKYALQIYENFTNILADFLKFHARRFEQGFFCHT